VREFSRAASRTARAHVEALSTQRPPSCSRTSVSSLLSAAAAANVALPVRSAGGSGEFTKASEDDGDDAEETKFDQFWTFPDIENEHSFSTFKEFKDIALMPALMAFKKLAIAKGLATDKDDVKAKGMRIAGPGFKWLQANFKSIQFFSVEVPTLSGSDHGCDDIETLSAQYGFLIDDGEKPYMYFLRDLFVASRF